MPIRCELWILCTVGLLAAAIEAKAQADSAYVGSKSCVVCHERHGVSWSETTHSRFMRSPASDETIAAENLFQAPSPIDIDDVAYVLGHMHKLAFLKEDVDGLVLLAHQYDCNKKTWEPLNAELWD